MRGARTHGEDRFALRFHGEYRRAGLGRAVGVDAADQHGTPEILQDGQGDEARDDDGFPTRPEPPGEGGVDEGGGAPERFRGGFLGSGGGDEAVASARGEAREQVQDEVDRSHENGHAAVAGARWRAGPGRGGLLDDGLNVVLDDLVGALIAHRFDENAAQRLVGEGHAHGVLQMRPDAWNFRIRRARAFEFFGVAHEVHDVQSVGDDGEQEDVAIARAGEDERARDHDRDGRAYLRPGAREAVDPGAFVFSALHPEPLEYHRLVRPGAERIAQGEGEHGEEQGCEGGRIAKDEERGDVGEKRENHRASSAVEIGHRAAGGSRRC